MNLPAVLRQPRCWAPTLVFVLGVAIAALTATELHRSERDQRELELSNLADGFGALLQMHLAGCEEALRAASMVASADPHLDARQWQAVGRQVRVGEFNACADTMIYVNAGAASDPSPTQASNGQPDAAKTGFARRTLIAPASADQGPLAQFDPLQDPLHRAAMEAARDQGQPRLTTRIGWPGIAEDIPVVVWYMPVYRRNAALDSPELRAAALTGYVGIPIRVPAVLEVLAQKFPNALLTLDCHSGASEMFDLPAAGPADASASTVGSATQIRERTLRIGGRWWSLHVGIADPPPDLLNGMHPSSMSLAAGLSLSALLAWLTWLMLTQSARAHALAHHYSRDAREREARLRSVLDGTRDGIFTLDVRGNILGTNHAVQEILGYTEADLLGQHTSLLLPPERAREYAELWIDFVRTARQREDGHGPVDELELRHRDGRTLCVRGSLSLVRTDAGEFVVWMVGDLTREREMERQARDVAALNQAIMDAAPIGVMTIGADSTIATANRACHAMHGYAPGDLVGQHADILNDPAEVEARAAERTAGPDDTRRPASEPSLSLLEAGDRLTEAEWTYVRKDGSRFPAGVIALPLRDTAGRSLGGLRMVMDITERKRAAARIEHMALHDSLTELPNRLLLQDRMQQTLARAQRCSGSFALMLIDLDRFKQINDTLGHAIGDEVLKIVGQRLTEAVRTSDTVVRMGGDEFALLLPDILNPEQATEVAQKVLVTMAEVLVIEKHRLHVTASVGIALYPAHGTDLPTLLRNADAAMYDAKARGRDALSLYDEKMSHQASEQIELRADLREALAREEFVLHYQPLVDSSSGEVQGLEALLRWQHPRRGLVSPLEFIPLAEDTGLIVPIGAWVLRKACSDLARLRREGRPNLRISVNVSPRQFTADGLETSVSEALQAAGLDGSALELEITESVLMHSLERTQGILAALRASGVSIAIDDFGTGYSSLSYLANFPVQTVKVDRSFVRQIDSGEGTALLAGAIIAMAHSLGLGVVAEGVETIGQHKHLVDLGCELLQGFRFSKPVAFEKLPEAMERVEAMPRLHPSTGIEVWTNPTPSIRH